MVPAAHRQCAGARRGCRSAEREQSRRAARWITFRKPCALAWERSVGCFHIAHLPKVSSMMLELVSSCRWRGQGREEDEERRTLSKTGEPAEQGLSGPLCHCLLPLLLAAAGRCCRSGGSRGGGGWGQQLARHRQAALCMLCHSSQAHLVAEPSQVQQQQHRANLDEVAGAARKALQGCAGASCCLRLAGATTTCGSIGSIPCTHHVLARLAHNSLFHTELRRPTRSAPRCGLPRAAPRSSPSRPTGRPHLRVRT